MEYNGLPEKQGLYDPQFEHDACGIGFIANIKGKTSHGIINQAIQILKNLAHRGGVGSEPDTGDGAGILIQMPHTFMKKVCKNEGIKLPKKGDYGVGMLFLSPDERSADPLSTVHRSMAEVRPSIMKIYGMTEAEADRYFSDMWLVAHSIATLTVTGRYPYSKAKIGEVLTGFSLSICRSIKDIPGFVSGKIDRDSEFEKLIK